MRTLMVLVVLAAAAAAGLWGYSHLGDMTAPQRTITIDVPPGGGG